MTKPKKINKESWERCTFSRLSKNPSGKAESAKHNACPTQRPDGSPPIHVRSLHTRVARRATRTEETVMEKKYSR